VLEILGGKANVFLIAPQDYRPFVWLMANSDLILTDSGGIQEEAPSLGKSVLVMRETTERPEAVEAGMVQLVGTSRVDVFDAVSRTMRSTNSVNRGVPVANPYGTGCAAMQIAAIVARWVQESRSAQP
jgi:UDP-N-acetylglucosamine 2-epimerase (non-hydrolysing)